MLGKERAIQTEQGRLENLASSAIYTLVHRFKTIQVDGRVIECPFWMNLDYLYEGTELYRSFPKGGKMSPAEIEGLIEQLVKETRFDFKSASGSEISEFLMHHGIGVDCSGFAYQCLRSVFLALMSGLSEEDFDREVKNAENGLSGITRVGVNDLASPLNSVEVESFSLIKPADFIVKGRHLVVIAGYTGDVINCVHASNEILHSGVHEFDIIIKNPDSSIFDQEWLEFTSDGKPYSVDLKAKVKPKDGIRRLRILDELYRGQKT